MERWRAGVLTALVALAAGPAGGQDIDGIFGRVLRQNAEAGLAVFGIAAVPSETASTLVLDSGSSERSGFRAAQLGGGATLSERVPVYVEGFLGLNRYDPVLLLSRGAEQSALPLKWTTVAATGGLGWEVGLTDDLSLIPMAHVTLGRIQSDSSVAAQVVANRLGLDTSFIDGGGMTVGGAGGSLSLVYNRRWENDWEADLTLRHTHIALTPIGENRDIVARADAITTAVWSRIRVPTGLTLFGRPVRVVGELSGSWLPGDQGRALGTDWLAQAGLGGEIDVSETWVPWITTTRIVARYTTGERLHGFSIGLAASF